MEAIPSEKRYADLKNKLDIFATAIHAVIAKVPAYDMRERNLFLALVRPWLLPPDVDATIKQASEPAKAIAEKAGFPAQEMAAEIQVIFDNDLHLRECCGKPLALAYLLDDLYVHPAATLILEGAANRLTDLFANFNDVVYGQGPYTRIAYSHIFNFSCTADQINIAPLLIQRLRSQDVASVLGGPTMPTQYTFLQPAQVGTFFIVREETGAVENLFDWLWKSHLQAIELFRVVQYHKNGVAYVDYSTLHFKPEWVNHLRKFGLFFVGNPRRLPYQNGARFFELPESDFAAIQRTMNVYLSPKVLQLMADETIPFRQGSLRAGDYYEASLGEDRPTARLIALAISLESLFSPADGQEISFKTALAASQLLGADAAERNAIFADLQELYRRRSKLMHGSYDVKKVYEGTFVTHEDVDRWSSYLRQSILRFLTLYLRGKKTKKDLDHLRQELLLCALDNAKAEQLRAMSDLDIFVNEESSTIGT